MPLRALLRRGDIPEDAKAAIREALTVSEGQAAVIQRDLAVALLAATSLPDALRACLDAAVHLSGLDAGGIYLVDEPTGDLHLVCHQGLSPQFVAAVGHVPADSPRGRVAHGRVSRYPTAAEMTRAGNEDIAREGLRACSAIPVVYQGRLIAQLNIASRSLDSIPEEARRVLEMIGGLVGVAVHRFQTAQELAESEERYRALVESAPDAIFAVDGEGTVLAVNPAAARLLGLSREAAVGGSLRDLFPSEEAERRIGIMRHIYGTKRQVTATYQEPYPGVGLRWFNAILSPVFDAQGEVRCVLGVARDITEQVEAEEALRRSERRYALATAAGKVAVWDWDVRTREVHDVAGLMGMLGYGPDELDQLPADWEELRHPDDRAAAGAATRPVHEGAADEFAFEQRLLHRDGSYRWVFTRGEAFRDECGRVVRMVGTNTDITEQKRAQDERQEIAARLQQAERLESLGVLAGGVAHDFSNLLTGLLGNLSLARRRLPQASPAHPYLQRVESAASQAAELAENMLAYSGRGLMQCAPLPMSELLLEALDFAAVSLPEGVELEVRVPAGLPPVLGEAAQLRGVVLNLIGNAAEAVGPAGGAIAVEATVVEADRARLARTYVDDSLPEGPYLSVVVSDPGPGMDAETLGRVFDPFFTTKPNGRGLGLAYALGVVRAHRGAIEVRSAPGEGSVFEVLLPVAFEPAEGNLARAPASEAACTIGGGTVLLAEDEALVRAAAVGALEEAGLTVLPASNGRQALELFKERAAEIDAVLLDLAMPEADGLAVLREVRRLRPDVPVIIASAYNGDAAAARLQETGPARFLRKPYRSEELVAHVREVMGLRTEARG